MRLKTMQARLTAGALGQPFKALGSHRAKFHGHTPLWERMFKAFRASLCEQPPNISVLPPNEA